MVSSYSNLVGLTKKRENIIKKITVSNRYGNNMTDNIIRRKKNVIKMAVISTFRKEIRETKLDMFHIIIIKKVLKGCVRLQV